MGQREYDPLAVIPSAHVLRQRLETTRRLADRLRIMLDVAERLEATERTADGPPRPTPAEGGGR